MPNRLRFPYWKKKPRKRTYFPSGIVTASGSYIYSLSLIFKFKGIILLNILILAYI